MKGCCGRPKAGFRPGREKETGRYGSDHFSPHDHGKNCWPLTKKKSLLLWIWSAFDRVMRVKLWKILPR